MRLLQIKDGSLSLVERLGDNIPAYAILSHTWGADDEEVTYRDLLDGKGKRKAGYRKLEFCMQQARHDLLEYFWIDTCCIDKASSSELTEAINSMFRWYQRARRCYVYLSDVVLGDGLPPLGVWQQSLKQSKWFSRGWTLQELIAPRSVEFFSFEGRLLGNRTSLETIIHDITGIHIEVLRGKPLSQVSVQERLSWATGRETKRDEDAAYALMGIFGVHMPAIYGEGRQNARLRLLEQIEAHFTIRLPSAEGASFNSHLQEHSAKCLPQTRTALLSHLSSWAQDLSSKPIFWLNGMAGTGKSTIARTIASAFAEQGQLGASFFFKSSEAELSNARRIFTTIAAGLAENVPEIIPGIRESIREDLTVFEKPLSVQFEKLILRPLKQISSASMDHVLKIVVVIDALDECGQDEDIRAILQLLPLVKNLRTIALRVFLTSRPELPIRLGFRKMSHVEYENMILHEIPPSVVQNDIEVFIWHELALIRDQRSLPEDWPTSDQVRKLADLATPLFIFAATACRYIGETKHNPQRRLELMLRHMEAKSSKLDATYLPIMNLLFEEEDEADKEYWAAEFRAIVGSIVLLLEPLSVNSISDLIGMSKFDVGCRLDALHSVLSVPDDDTLPVRLLHLSFRDFLLDPQKQGKSPLWIDEGKTHEELALHCIDLMSGPQGLRRNLCHLPEPGYWLRDSVREQIAGLLSPALSYACRYWVEHLVLGNLVAHDNSPVYTFLQQHLLHWLEAMSLLGGAPAVPKMLETLRNEATPAESSIRRFLEDALRFVSRFAMIVRDIPLQMYTSALLFSRENCMIRTTFATYIDSWPEKLVRMSGHDGPVHDIKFSNDGRLVASASSGQHCVWDVMTGRCLSRYTEHLSNVSMVQWSQDGRLLASSCADGVIQLWDPSTEFCHATLRGHSREINALQFSGTGQLLVSASNDKTVRVWNASTRLCQATLVGHSSAVRAVVFSMDACAIASASDDGTVRIWDTATGICRATLIGHEDIVTSVTFSRHGKLVASTSRDLTTRVWNLEDALPYRVLQGHSALVTTAAFSPDGQMLATAAQDSTIRLWDIRQGTYTSIAGKCAPAPWCIKSLSFSQDGRYLETDHGLIRIPSNEATLQTAVQNTLSATSVWVVHRQEPVLGLPAGFERLCSTTHGDTICLGHRSGSWTLLRFDDDGNLTRLWMFVGTSRGLLQP